MHRDMYTEPVFMPGYGLHWDPIFHLDSGGIYPIKDSHYRKATLVTDKI